MIQPMTILYDIIHYNMSTVLMIIMIKMIMIILMIIVMVIIAAIMIIMIRPPGGASGWGPRRQR